MKTTQVLTAKRLREFKKSADQIVASIARERDKLRALVGEYSEILETVNAAHDDFDRGLDTISQYL